TSPVHGEREQEQSQPRARHGQSAATATATARACDWLAGWLACPSWSVPWPRRHRLRRTRPLLLSGSSLRAAPAHVTTRHSPKQRGPATRPASTSPSPTSCKLILSKR